MDNREGGVVGPLETTGCPHLLAEVIDAILEFRMLQGPPTIILIGCSDKARTEPKALPSRPSPLTSTAPASHTNDRSAQCTAVIVVSLVLDEDVRDTIWIIHQEAAD